MRFLLLTLSVSVALASCGRVEVTIQAPSETLPPTPAADAAAVTDAAPTLPSSSSPEQCDLLENDTILPSKPDDPRGYIGRHYDELQMPEGLVFQGGAVLTDDTLWEWVSRPDFDMLFLSQTLCRDSAGVPYNTVVDAIRIPRAQEGYGRADVCSPSPGPGSAIVFGKFDKSQPETTLDGVQGWRMYELDFGQQINLQTMRFEPLSLEGLECLHMSGLGS